MSVLDTSRTTSPGDATAAPGQRPQQDRPPVPREDERHVALVPVDEQAVAGRRRREGGAGQRQAGDLDQPRLEAQRAAHLLVLGHHGAEGGGDHDRVRRAVARGGVGEARLADLERDGLAQPEAEQLVDLGRLAGGDLDRGHEGHAGHGVGQDQRDLRAAEDPRPLQGAVHGLAEPRAVDDVRLGQRERQRPRRQLHDRRRAHHQAPLLAADAQHAHRRRAHLDRDRGPVGLHELPAHPARRPRRGRGGRRPTTALTAPPRR